MNELGIVVDLVAATIAAFVGGMLALRLRQPVILGYLLAGVAIGPYTPGPISDTHNVQLMAELGVAFLMFALGVEFSPSELLKMRWVASVGGVLQIVATLLLGVAIAPLLGFNLFQGLFLGSVIALSSTMVALKLLMARGEMESLHGRIVLGILIVQDLSVVPMMVILPALAGPVDGLLPELAIAAAKAAVILTGARYLGTKIVPFILSRVAATGVFEELFLLAIISLALGTALGTYSLGLSIAFGAFMAGLVLSESEFSHQALAESLPLRDIFSSIFFVSVGMLIDPVFLVSNAAEILLVVVAVVAGKLIICTAVPMLFGYPGRAALLAGLSLAQIGEFSFVLTRLGQDRGVIDSHFSSLILASALLSILLNPLLMHEGWRLHALLSRIPLAGRLFWDRFEVPSMVHRPLEGHVVICGYGRVGREMAGALAIRGEPYLVVEMDPHVVSELRHSGTNYIYGDAANATVLAHTQLARARLVAATVPDAASVEMVVRNARRLNPSVSIIARVHSPQDMERVLKAGADEAVCPEFEAGLEFVRHALERFGATEDEAGELIRRRRDARKQR